MLDDSVIIEDYFASPLKSGHENLLTTTTGNINLVCFGYEFSWDGILDRLKAFIQHDLELEGNWSSPGGYMKVYAGSKYTKKWYGRSKNLRIVRDGSEQNVCKRLKVLSVKTCKEKPCDESYKYNPKEIWCRRKVKS